MKPDTKEYFQKLVDNADRLLPNISNIFYYAEEIRGKSRLRSGIELGRQIATLCYEETSSEEAMHKLEEMFSSFLLKQVVNDYLVSTKEAFQQFSKDIYDRIKKKAMGVETGFKQIDLLINRLEDLVILAARPGMGKGHSLDTPVLTPTGFVPMGTLRMGDRVLGKGGEFSFVTGIYPLGKVPIYNVTTTDGRSVEVTEDHLWLTETRNERRAITQNWSVKTTKEISETITRSDNDSPNHALPINEPCRFESIEPLKVNPYLMGLLLGDGSFRSGIKITNSEISIQNKLPALLPLGDSVRFRGKEGNISGGNTRAAIKYYGLFGKYSYEKSIPPQYLYASIEERIELLQGLFDADGYVIDGGHSIEYSTSSEDLCIDVKFLAYSLGGIVSITTKIPTYTYRGKKLIGKKSYRMVIRFNSDLVPVSSQKHLAKWIGPSGRQEHVSIKSIDYVGNKEAQCIRVSAPDSLYITKDFIVTHNTALAINIARNVAATKPVLFFSLEQSREQIFERVLAGESEVDHEDIRTGAFIGDPKDKDKVEKAQEALLEVFERIHVDDRPGINAAYIASVARQKKYEWGEIGLIIVDYLHIMRMNDKLNTVEALGEASKDLRNLGKELGCPVLLLAQLSRQNENREINKKPNKRPQLSDLRASGEIEQTADIVMFLYRDSYYDLAGMGPEDDSMEVIVQKHRNGRTGIATIRWLPRFVLFKDF